MARHFSLTKGIVWEVTAVGVEIKLPQRNNLRICHSKETKGLRFGDEVWVALNFTRPRLYTNLPEDQALPVLEECPDDPYEEEVGVDEECRLWLQHQ